jgi:ribonuclease P protein component, eubacterial
MLPKINRIKKEKDFGEVFRNSRSFKNALFIFKVKENSIGVNRFGFVVSNKVSKKAVVRNKIKRRLSEAVKIRMGNIKIGRDLVFIALPVIGKKEFSEIKEAVDSALISANLLNKDNKNV